MVSIMEYNGNKKWVKSNHFYRQMYYLVFCILCFYTSPFFSDWLDSAKHAFSLLIELFLYSFDCEWSLKRGNIAAYCTPQRIAFLPYGLLLFFNILTIMVFRACRVVCLSTLKTTTFNGQQRKQKNQFIFINLKTPRRQI